MNPPHKKICLFHICCYQSIFANISANIKCFTKTFSLFIIHHFNKMYKYFLKQFSFLYYITTFSKCKYLKLKYLLPFFPSLSKSTEHTRNALRQVLSGIFGNQLFESRKTLRYAFARILILASSKGTFTIFSSSNCSCGRRSK